MGKISMPQGKGSQLHNRREYEKIGKEIPSHIDKSKMIENEILVDRDIKQAYQEIFDDSVREYNERQKRADRKIENYYENIKNSKNGERLFYENVVQWGKKDDFNDPANREKAKTALKEYAETFPERNPNLKLIGAYIHMDEASPHMHIDYIPVAGGYKTGMKTRNSLDRAMKEMGFRPENENRKNNATKMWKDRERAYFADLCRKNGLKVEKEEKYNRKRLTPEEYREEKEKYMKEFQADLDSKYNTIAESCRWISKERKELEEREKVIELYEGAPEKLRSYSDKIDELTEQVLDYRERVFELNRKLADSDETIKNIVMAAGLLKYDDDEGGYRIDNLSRKQERLIDGIAEYAISKTDPEKTTMIEKMKKEVTINEEIESFIEPKQTKRHRGYDLGR